MLREVKEIPGGFLHTIELKKVLKDYRGGKLDIQVEAYTDTWDENLKMSRLINAGYRSAVSHRKSIKVR